MRAENVTLESIQDELFSMWRQILQKESFTIDDHFALLGGTADHGYQLVVKIAERFGCPIHKSWVLTCPTVYQQALVLHKACRATPEPLQQRGEVPEPAPDPKVWRAYANKIVEGGPTPRLEAPNPPAVFVLTPGRSGSTLLRVMLAGHPQLFAPPELELLNYKDMAQRNKGLVDGWQDAFGLERAVMELWGCEAQESRHIVAKFRKDNLPIWQVYRQLQERCGDKLLVDKSPVYSTAFSTLQRAEAWFEGARYIHLIRHPLAMIRSWKKAQFDQIVPLPPRAAAEMNWLISHENILRFLKDVPPQRHCRVRFEEMVTEPEPTMRAVASFLGLPYLEALINPYDGDRMTEAKGGMLVAGDPLFFTRKTLEAAAAEASKRRPEDIELTRDVADLARHLGYTEV